MGATRKKPYEILLAFVLTAATTTDKVATFAAHGAQVVPQRAALKKGAPKGQKTAKGAKLKAATAKKAAKANAKASKTATKPGTATTPAEIVKATEWQAHNVRGFVSSAAKKHGVKIESARHDAGERTYNAK
jgi:hypothetical protein